MTQFQRGMDVSRFVLVGRHEVAVHGNLKHQTCRSSQTHGTQHQPSDTSLKGTKQPSRRFNSTRWTDPGKALFRGARIFISGHIWSLPSSTITINQGRLQESLLSSRTEAFELAKGSIPPTFDNGMLTISSTLEPLMPVPLISHNELTTQATRELPSAFTLTHIALRIIDVKPPTEELTATANPPLGHPKYRLGPILLSSQNHPLDVDLVQSVSRLPSPVPDTTAKMQLGIPSPTTATEDLKTRPTLDILFKRHSSSQTPSLTSLGHPPSSLQRSMSPRPSTSLAYFDPRPAAAFV
ncbi:hypothetical protein BDP55DRAFT_717837 [Colletotrichum godetiae]|uniref:Uncharacterized protein n=1 Tax=Colletotrichum godetiae TaxID=1209918 RepID=A0AAJ0EQB6_9PEZI|nr:uncharacterized protein BDP55DRAFT_717837 [Colletotrichum godetiae]KAK1672621.1 hypothetical protein BDP55DRAFT_717837 [Colletotrichum godetiae]